MTTQANADMLNKMVNPNKVTNELRVWGFKNQPTVAGGEVRFSNNDDLAIYITKDFTVQVFDNGMLGEYTTYSEWIACMLKLGYQVGKSDRVVEFEVTDEPAPVNGSPNMVKFFDMAIGAGFKIRDGSYVSNTRQEMYLTKGDKSWQVSIMFDREVSLYRREASLSYESREAGLSYEPYEPLGLTTDLDKFEDMLIREDLMQDRVTVKEGSCSTAEWDAFKSWLHAKGIHKRDHSYTDHTVWKIRYGSIVLGDMKSLDVDIYNDGLIKLFKDMDFAIKTRDIPTAKHWIETELSRIEHDKANEKLADKIAPKSLKTTPTMDIAEKIVDKTETECDYEQFIALVNTLESNLICLDETVEINDNEYRLISEDHIDAVYHESQVELIKECYMGNNNLPDWIDINWKQTTDNVKDVDGMGHHFSSYDGSEEYVSIAVEGESSGIYIFRTN